MIRKIILLGLVLNQASVLSAQTDLNYPGKDKRLNWLPAPDGPVFFSNRLYLPNPEAFNSTWNPQPLVRV